MSENPKARVRLKLAWVICCLLTSFACPALAEAQSGPPAPESRESAVPVIGTIRVSGNTTVDSARIVTTMELAPGQRYSAEAVRRGVRKLLALGLFSDVTPRRGELVDGALDLVIEVRERPRISTIGFRGNQKREDVDLEKKLFMRPGETLSLTQVQLQTDSLTAYYREEGFPRVSIEAVLDTLAASNQVALVFQVTEGEKLRITRIRFTGASAFGEKRLRKAMKTKQKGFFGGGELKDETFAEDRERLQAFYQDRGYRDARVDDVTLSPGAEPRHLTLNVALSEGRYHTLGEVSWSGNSVVETATLERLWSPKPGSRYEKDRIARVQSDVYSLYAERGYLYLGVEPRESVRDTVVDVEFRITEGRPSQVRLVSITGNRGTREHVIRREIDIHEGDRFRRSALIRSQGDIMRLGLFESVIPDFQPAESTDVDLVFRVKEKSVGTASAGAGFTNETGVTGFLDIGHSNVLGNGQALQLHLERGSQREEYTLSFTEPWFRGTPTLLGISAYNTYRELQEYDQRRRGGTVRLGRPLPWPDYSRGSVAYTLEELLIKNVVSTITVGGIKIGEPQLSSALETTFLRNSTDNPFYPSKGTRLSFNDEFNGGPFGGDLHFHKHRYEGRVYFPSLLKSFTSMARLRLGTVAQYNWRDDAIPDYARFRLGGGTTIDPLRGYEDYQVVPGKFITDVILGYTNRDTVYIGNDPMNGIERIDSTAVTVKRRYPGGRYMALFTFEQQFPIVVPLRGVFFFDAGDVWDMRSEIRPFDLKVGAGFGARMEVPILGNIGFDYGYGFHRDDGARWKGHFLLGNFNF